MTSGISLVSMKFLHPLTTSVFLAPNELPLPFCHSS